MLVIKCLLITNWVENTEPVAMAHCKKTRVRYSFSPQRLFLAMKYLWLQKETEYVECTERCMQILDGFWHKRHSFSTERSEKIFGWDAIWWTGHGVADAIWMRCHLMDRTWSCREPVGERLHLEILDSFLVIIISIGGISSLY